MNILYIAYAFPPVNIVASHRALFQTVYMAKAGAQVTVVCARQSSKRDDPSLLEYLENVPGVSVHWVAPWGAKAGRSGLKASSKGWLWVARAVRLARRLARQQSFDVVCSTYGPEYPHIAARFLQYRLRIPWVAEFRDPWHGGRKNQRSGAGWGVTFERWVLKPAHLLVAASEGFSDILREIHGASRRYAVVYNGYEANAVAGKTGTNEARNGLRVVLVGTLYPFQQPSLEILLDAIRRVPTVTFCYFGSSTRNVEKCIAHFQLESQSEVQSLVPHREVIQHIAEADVAFLPGSDRFRGVIPVKYYDYLGTHTPVLMIGGAGTELESILRGTDSGVNANTVEEVKSWLQDMSAGKVTYSFAEADFFSRQQQAERLLSYLEQCVEETT